MFTTDLVNLYNRNIFKTSLYTKRTEYLMYILFSLSVIFQDEKCRLMRNLSLSMLPMLPYRAGETVFRQGRMFTYQEKCILSQICKRSHSQKIRNFLYF